MTCYITCIKTTQNNANYLLSNSYSLQRNNGHKNLSYPQHITYNTHIHEFLKDTLESQNTSITLFNHDNPKTV